MNQYVVAWVSLFDNNLMQEIVVAESAPKAVIKYVRDILENTYHADILEKLADESIRNGEVNNTVWLEAVQDSMFDCDQNVSVIQI